jgi:imidazolonepropionase-like amidohydrolase
MSALVPALLALAAAFTVENVRVEVGDGRVLEGATVVIDKGRIVRVHEGAGPAVGERIDGRGKTLAPGFIETQGQLGLAEVLGEATSYDATAGDGPFSPGFRAGDGFQPRSVRFSIEREEGITSAIASPTGGVLAGTGVWFELTGEPKDAPDPRAPVAMFGSIAQAAVDSAGRSRGALWLRVRESLDDARAYKSGKAAYDKAQLRTLSLSRVHLEALLPVADGKLPLVITANRASDIFAALRLRDEEKIQIVLAGGAEAWLVRKELAAAGVPVVYQPSLMEPSGFESLHARDDGAALLHEAGVKIVLTANAGWDESARRLRQEAGIAVAHGLPRDVALRAITLTPAEVFGKARELGSIAEGKRANLVLWSGDPLELSSVVEALWIDGRPQSLDNRQRKLARKYLEVAKPR